jgi:hypothetical protein
MDGNVSKEELAIHEASHAVVAKLFEDNLHLQKMTIAEEPDSMTDEKSTKKLGMIGVVGKESVWVSAGVVSLAGMMGETIAAQSPLQVLQNKESILSNPDQYLKTSLGGGDFILFKMDSAVNARHYGTEKDYEQLCLHFLIDFLCNDFIWDMVKHVKEAVLQKDDLTLNELELDTLFEATRYTTYIRENKGQLLEPFRKSVDTDSIEWQAGQMMKGEDVNLFDNGNSKNNN